MEKTKKEEEEVKMKHKKWDEMWHGDSNILCFSSYIKEFQVLYACVFSIPCFIKYFLYFHIHTPHSVNCFLIFYVLFPLPLFHLVVRLEQHLSIYYSFVFHLMHQWHHLIFALLLHFYHLHFTIHFSVFHLLNV